MSKRTKVLEVVKRADTFPGNCVTLAYFDTEGEAQEFGGKLLASLDVRIINHHPRFSVELSYSISFREEEQS